MEQFNFEIKGKKYTTERVVVGKIIDMWKMRMALSMGTYGQMYRTALVNSDEALIAINVESFFTVFCPQLIKDLKPATFQELGIEDYIEIRDLFINQAQPWLSKIEELLNKK
jgi:hypothetical protein